MKVILDRTEAPDVTVTCGSLTLPLHSFLLATDSKFFATMLDAPMVEKERKKINIKDVDHEVFEKVILFIYTTELDFDVMRQLEGMLDAAERFDMEELKTVIKGVVKEFIFISDEVGFSSTREVTRDFLVNTGTLAEMYNAEELLDLAASEIVNHGITLEKKEVSKSPGLAVAVMAKMEERWKDGKMEGGKMEEKVEKWKWECSLLYDENEVKYEEIRDRTNIMHALGEEINELHQIQEQGEEEVAKLKEELMFMAFEAWRSNNPDF